MDAAKMSTCGPNGSGGKRSSSPLSARHLAAMAEEDLWWAEHTRDRGRRRDVDAEWREYAMARVEQRENFRCKRPREGEGWAVVADCDRRVRPSRDIQQNVSEAALAAAAAAQEALSAQLVSVLSRFSNLAAAGCDGCGHCAICIAAARCGRCEQCNACYEAEALNGQRQKATLVAVVQRIYALPTPPAREPAHAAHIAAAMLGGTAQWEAAWEAGRATATVEQRLEALWERAAAVIGCLDRQLALTSLPPAIQEAAQIVAARQIAGAPAVGPAQH